MARNLGTVKQTKLVKVQCVDNDRTVEAVLIEKYPDKLIVELPGGIRLVMKKHHIHRNIYIATHSGMEFQCKMI